jgi:hypothetical protein
MPVAPNDPSPPRGPIWGFHAANRLTRKNVDPILLVDRDPEVCRILAERLAVAGYSVEWTVDPAVAPSWASVVRYALLLAEECPEGIADADADLPVLVIGKPIAAAAVLALIRTRARTRDPRFRLGQEQP